MEADHFLSERDMWDIFFSVDNEFSELAIMVAVAFHNKIVPVDFAGEYYSEQAFRVGDERAGANDDPVFAFCGGGNEFPYVAHGVELDPVCVSESGVNNIFHFISSFLVYSPSSVFAGIIRAVYE